ncbi:hypothetical protein BH20ACT2_BH20ACT2_03960 [soil metagenome]
MRLFQAGVAHYRWMDLFLGHISTHFVPGRNLTWFTIALTSLAIYVYAVDRLPPGDGYGPLHVECRGPARPWYWSTGSAPRPATGNR